MLGIKNSQTVYETDTVIFVLKLVNTRQNTPIVDAVSVEFTLHGPDGFLTASRSLVEQEVTNGLDGSYEATFELGGQGEYICVATGISAAGHRKSEQYSFYATALQGV